MSNAIEFLTFDVYGTLAAWDEALLASIAAALPEATPRARQRAARIMDAESRRLQTSGPFRSYVDILRDSATLALAEYDGAGVAIDDILSRLADVSPHPDAPVALAALAGDFRLIAISNSDDAFLARTLANLGDVWTGVVTAQQAQAYKPNPELFRFASRSQGIEPGRQLHIAQGMFSDLVVCASLAIPAIWINRTDTNVQRGLTPFATLPDVVSLPRVVDEYTRSGVASADLRKEP